MNTPSRDWHLACDIPCAQGDAPFWHAQEDRLYWIDRSLRRILRLHVPSQQVESWTLHEEPVALSACRSGALLIVTRNAIYRSETWHDIPQTLRLLPSGTTCEQALCGLTDPWGRFWLVREKGAGATGLLELLCLHALTHSGAQLHALGLTGATAMAWSASLNALCMVENKHQRVVVQPLSQPGTWPPALGASMPLARFTPPGYPSGVAVDRLGQTWISMEGTGELLCLDPSGQVVQRMATPCLAPRGLCFGGKDLKTLYLTSARSGRSCEELSRYPDSGAVFSVQVDVPGVPSHAYWD